MRPSCVSPFSVGLNRVIEHETFFPSDVLNVLLCSACERATPSLETPCGVTDILKLMLR